MTHLDDGRPALNDSIRLDSGFPPAQTGHEMPGRSEFLALEGQRVSLALADGSRVDDVDLVSVGRGRAGTLWVFTSGSDVFIPLADVIDFWAAPPTVTRRAA